MKATIKTSGCYHFLNGMEVTVVKPIDDNLVRVSYGNPVIEIDLLNGEIVPHIQTASLAERELYNL